MLAFCAIVFGSTTRAYSALRRARQGGKELSWDRARSQTLAHRAASRYYQLTALTLNRYVLAVDYESKRDGDTTNRADHVSERK
jgi:hypothetical protein